MHFVHILLPYLALMLVPVVGLIAVTKSNQSIIQSIRGRYYKRGKLVVTVLVVAADNTIPHSLPFTPSRYWYVANLDGTWYEKQPPDATNFYIHVNGGGPTAITIFYES